MTTLRGGRGLRVLGCTGLGVIAVAALVTLHISYPPDTGVWEAFALPATSVTDLAVADDLVVAAHDSAITVVRSDGGTADVALPGPAEDIVTADGRILAATTDGVVAVPLDGGAADRAGLRGLAVNAIAVVDDGVYAGSEQGLHRRAATGDWVRLWPAPGEPAVAVSAMVSSAGDLLMVADGAVRRWTGREQPQQVLRPAQGAPVISLATGPLPGQVWAGLRGGPLLLESRDAGRTWTQRGTGLGFSAVNDVAGDPAHPDRLVAGGSGLADGTGNAGVQESADGGLVWTAEQGLLTNTHVYAVDVREEPVRLELSMPLIGRSWSVTLPTRVTRAYAATNGSGVYSYAPASPLATALQSAHPVLRVAEPVLLGLLAALVLVPAYVGLTAAGVPGHGSRRRSTDSSAQPTRRNT